MLTDFFHAYFFIFIAEMADKSQILAMIFATKYKVKYVLFGLFFGAALNHGIAILLGYSLGGVIPLKAIGLLTGVLFLIFGLWSLRVEEEDEEDMKEGRFGPIITVMLAFFLGELGDKTQITAMTLATQSISPVVTWLGTVLGMVSTGAISIWVGSRLGKRIPEMLMKCVSAIIFIFFGSLKLYEFLPAQYTGFGVLAVYFSIIGYVCYKMINKNIRQEKVSSYRRAASILYDYTHEIQEVVRDICIGCKTCQKNHCIIGRAKVMIEMALREEDWESHLDEEMALQLKDFDMEKVKRGLALTLEGIRQLEEVKGDTYLLNTLRMAMEKILINKSLNVEGDLKAYFLMLEQYDQELARELKQMQ